MGITKQDEAVIVKRLLQYERENVEEQRNQLVELWRKHYPEAAAERSNAFHPLVRQDKEDQGFESPMNVDPSREVEPQEQWTSDVYFVTVRRWKKDPVFGSSGGMVQLGIASLDGTARHDWRGFQAIKNQLAGPECEAFELYPAESRLLDPSNYFTIWAFPGIRAIKVGRPETVVRPSNKAWAPQRKFAEE